MVTLDLSKLARLRPKVDIGLTKEALKDNKYGKVPTVTIHDLRKTHKNRQQRESVRKINHSAKIIDKLLDKIREL